MENNAQYWELITKIVTGAIPFVIGWNVWLHNKLIKNEKDIAVNTAKDDEMWARMDKMINKLENIQQDITSIKVELAHIQGKHS